MKYLGASVFCRSGSGGNNVTFHFIPMEEEGSPSPTHDCTQPLLTGPFYPHIGLYSALVSKVSLAPAIKWPQSKKEPVNRRQSVMPTNGFCLHSTTETGEKCLCI